MGINRHCGLFRAKKDPDLCCVICGAHLPLYDLDQVLQEREDWAKLVIKRGQFGSAIVPAEELEQTDFVKHPSVWSFFFRAILEDPTTSQISLSGISHGSSLRPWELPIPGDPQRAFIKNSALKQNRWNADFHMANLFEPDWNREAGERIGYPIHAHCWLLLERFVGHDLIMSNLHAFVRAVEGFWKENKRHWAFVLEHVSSDGLCEGWPRDQDTGTPGSCFFGSPYWHSPGSPLRIPDIQRLITQNMQPQKDNSGQGQNGIQSQVFCLPLDIAMTVVDLIYETQPYCQQRIDNIRNLLEAFRWRLPNTYWQARCNKQLLFELDDLIKAETAVNWPGLCLGIEELLVDNDRYCNSGLKCRARTLKLLKGIKETFLRLLNEGVGQ